MRKRDDIKILDNILQEDKDNESESAIFPTPPANHNQFCYVLNEVVRANFKENDSLFGGRVGRVEYHEYDYRFYVEIKRSPYSVYDSWKDTIDFPEWIENQNFSGHSLRSGFATVAADSGADERSIMAMTGHKTTQMVRRYIKEANLFKNNALNKIKL